MESNEYIQNPKLFIKKSNEMKNLIKLFTLSLLLFNLNLTAQQLTQTIRGTVVDVDTREPLIGANVYVGDVEGNVGTVTDIDGKFVLNNVPVGRRTIKCGYIGYGEFVRDNIQVNSAKEYILDIELKAGIMVEEIVVKAYTRNEAVNELAVMSVRRLDPEELQYHAATANDPSRLVMGFPGVQPSRDSRSDVVIRGNSSAGLLWRLNGIDIPNPNHFARRGTSGGGITIFSAAMLGSSDFSVGAFPAEYGNAFSGVFDMNFRNGNMYNREHTFKAGLLGLDIASEGPIKKEKSSYLANFRYSTLGILNKMGIYLVGPRTDNNFYDLSFNLYHKGEKANFNFWGIGGNSIELFRPSDDIRTVFDDSYTYNFETNMGALGGSMNYLIDSKSYLKVNVAVMGQRVVISDDTLNVAGTEQTTLNYDDYTNKRISLSTFYKRTFNPKMNMKVGALVSNLGYKFILREWDFDARQQNEVINSNGNTLLAQPYVQFSFRPTYNLTLNAGLHSIFLALNNTNSIEPRLSLKYQITEKASFALAYGLHGRMLPLGSYFTEVNGELPNFDLKMIKAHHFVAAFDQALGDKYRLHLETYYQTLNNVPINAAQKYWMLNDVQGFATDALTSEGTGQNVGIDLFLERFFDKGAFFVLSGSVFNSTFSLPNDDTKYNTQYNSRVAGTFTGGKIFQINANTTIETGLKLLFNGGMPITPLLAGSENADGFRPVLDNTRPFSEKIDPYFRPDIRIALRKNREKFAYWLALDIQNVINKQNMDGLTYTFDRELDSWRNRYQSSLTPILSFQIDF
ncbi:MAG: TonB-dependent receptor [Saprospiraceae bacterium]|nr:TonB-dependent receptor [Saprospiraceae bacterium]